METTQLQAMTLARHRRTLERVRERETAAQAAAAQPARFAETLKAAPGAPPAEPPAAIPAPERTLAIQPTAAPSTKAAPSRALPPDQAALLAASLGVTPEAIGDTPAADATPALSDDQMATLMSAFGAEAPPAAAEATATAIPDAAAGLRYFPITSEGTTRATAAQATASDTYLRAMQQMERNLGAYGGRARGY